MYVGATVVFLATVITPFKKIPLINCVLEPHKSIVREMPRKKWHRLEIFLLQALLG